MTRPTGSRPSRAAWSAALAGALLCAACARGNGGGDAAAAGSDSAGAPRARAGNSTPGLAPDVSGACERVVQLASRVRLARAMRSDSTFKDPLTQRERRGCVVHVDGTLSALPKGTTPVAFVESGLAAEGWRADQRYAMNGPAGTDYALRAGAVLCTVSGRWAAKPVSSPAVAVDTTGAVRDPYAVEVRCAADSSRAGRRSR